MRATAESDHHEDLAGIGAGTGKRRKHLNAGFTESGREVVISACVAYRVNGIGDEESVVDHVKVKFSVRALVERRHTYLYLVWPDVELPDDVS